MGTPAEVRSAALGGNALSGRVNYIDPQLNEETRTARVRVEVANPGERLKAGMFVEVGFQTGTGAATGEELMVQSEAVQRDRRPHGRFHSKGREPAAFEVREVELGGETEGYRKVLSGLQARRESSDQRQLHLKTQMMKGEMGEHDH